MNSHEDGHNYPLILAQDALRLASVQVAKRVHCSEILVLLKEDTGHKNKQCHIFPKFLQYMEILRCCKICVCSDIS
jgi:hypothetical protein